MLTVPDAAMSNQFTKDSVQLGVDWYLERTGQTQVWHVCHPLWPEMTPAVIGNGLGTRATARIVSFPSSI